MFYKIAVSGADQYIVYDKMKFSANFFSDRINRNLQVWDNAVGEERIVCEWNEAEKKYREKERDFEENSQKIQKIICKMTETSCAKQQY